jgi:hypothetical protein
MRGHDRNEERNRPVGGGRYSGLLLPVFPSSTPKPLLPPNTHQATRSTHIHPVSRQQCQQPNPSLTTLATLFRCFEGMYRCSRTGRGTRIRGEFSREGNSETESDESTANP